MSSTDKPDILTICNVILTFKEAELLEAVLHERLASTANWLETAVIHADSWQGPPARELALDRVKTRDAYAKIRQHAQDGRRRRRRSRTRGGRRVVLIEPDGTPAPSSVAGVLSRQGCGTY